MIPSASPVVQALLGTLMTWGLTALGASVAFFVTGHQRKILDGSLGFAAGVMLAASYWSLLAPGIEMAAASGMYGADGQFAFIPVGVGFILGAVFVYMSDVVLSYTGVQSPLSIVLQVAGSSDKFSKDGSPTHMTSIVTDDPSSESLIRRRARRHRTPSCDSAEEGIPENDILRTSQELVATAQWKRILLLIIAVTVHNIPEGLAVGVAFGAVGKSATATFENARNLAIGIGLQNFPEGLAVSLPLKAAGFSGARSIWYGQLSGLVEPVAGVLGALLVTYMEPILPYSLGFAAGAMVYVVLDDIVPESQTCGNGKIASWGGIVGFVVMMCLDVGLG